jgi:hypothetical protein
MTIREKLQLLNIECIKSDKNDFESVYDFKLKNQEVNKCRFATNLRILTEDDLNVIEFGNIITSLKKLNTIEKGYRFLPYIAGELIFTIHR